MTFTLFENRKFQKRKNKKKKVMCGGKKLPQNYKKKLNDFHWNGYALEINNKKLPLDSLRATFT